MELYTALAEDPGLQVWLLVPMSAVLQSPITPGPGEFLHSSDRLSHDGLLTWKPAVPYGPDIDTVGLHFSRP